MGAPGGPPRPPRASASTMGGAAAAWRIEGKEVKRSAAVEKEEASRMPRTDSYQRYGLLTIQCFDRLSRKPLPGCAVCVSRVTSKTSKGGPHATPRRMKNAASTFGQATVSDEDVSSPPPQLCRRSSTAQIRHLLSLPHDCVSSRTLFSLFFLLHFNIPSSPLET